MVPKTFFRRTSVTLISFPVPGTNFTVLKELVCSTFGVVRLFVLSSLEAIRKADGAAGRPLKAHAPHEPVIPAEANQTICVVGASGFGRPIAEAAHRPERYAVLAGVRETDTATPETEAVVLLAENLHQKIYVNQVETETDRENALRLAALLRCPAAAGSLLKGEYFICSY